VERIRRFTQTEGHRRDECAILYRTTAQSRLFEEALIQAQIPYRVYGGLRFFERAEIRDALAYLRSGRQPGRRCRLRARGQYTEPGHRRPHPGSVAPAGARDAGLALAGGGRSDRDLVLGPRGGAALLGFIDLVRDQRRAREGLALHELVTALIEAAGLPDFYKKNKDGKGQDRVENLEQLVDTAARFEEDLHEEETTRSRCFSRMPHWRRAIPKPTASRTVCSS
jgi:DNA helicase II / ATP-dependent DNA helicase PcrA